MAAIYALKSTRDNVIRYVGQALTLTTIVWFRVYQWLQRERWLSRRQHQ